MISGPDCTVWANRVGGFGHRQAITVTNAQAAREQGSVAGFAWVFTNAFGVPQRLVQTYTEARNAKANANLLKWMHYGEPEHKR